MLAAGDYRRCDWGHGARGTCLGSEIHVSTWDYVWQGRDTGEAPGEGGRLQGLCRQQRTAALGPGRNTPSDGALRPPCQGGAETGLLPWGHGPELLGRADTQGLSKY